MRACVRASLCAWQPLQPQPRATPAAAPSLLAVKTRAFINHHSLALPACNAAYRRRFHTDPAESETTDSLCFSGSQHQSAARRYHTPHAHRETRIDKRLRAQLGKVYLLATPLTFFNIVVFYKPELSFRLISALVFNILFLPYFTVGKKKQQPMLEPTSTNWKFEKSSRRDLGINSRTWARKRLTEDRSTGQFGEHGANATRGKSSQTDFWLNSFLLFRRHFAYLPTLHLTFALISSLAAILLCSGYSIRPERFLSARLTCYLPHCE